MVVAVLEDHNLFLTWEVVQDFEYIEWAEACPNEDRGPATNLLKVDSQHLPSFFHYCFYSSYHYCRLCSVAAPHPDQVYVTTLLYHQ